MADAIAAAPGSATTDWTTYQDIGVPSQFLFHAIFFPVAMFAFLVVPGIICYFSLAFGHRGRIQQYSPPNARFGSTAASLDLLTVTSTELQELLSYGSITSVDLVDLYLDQIERENHNGLKMNAMISVTPRSIIQRTAQNLDREREQGVIRSPLHGIPIIVKNNIMTGPELQLPTTLGIYPLQDEIAKENAPVIDKLIKAGAIILGKAKLSEMPGYKGSSLTTEWSDPSDQTESPYIVGGFKDGDRLLGHSAPDDSSSGSAAGVAAGFAPLILATETDGSIVQPANLAALYGLKATVGLITTEGTVPWNPMSDSIGGMARSPQDLSALLEVLVGVARDTEDKVIVQGGDEEPPEPWVGLHVGFVDPDLWSSPVICDPDPVFIQQQIEEMDVAVSKIENSGAMVERSVPFPTMDELRLEIDDALEQLWTHDFSHGWEVYPRGYQGSKIPFRSLRDMAEFNKQNAHKELPITLAHNNVHVDRVASMTYSTQPGFPGQQLLEDATDDGKRVSAEKYEEHVHILHNSAHMQSFDKMLAAHDLDVILGPMDGSIPTIASAAGCPVGTMPLGYSKTNGRRFGMCIVAAEGREDKILRAMSAWDAIIAKRKVSPHLQNNQAAVRAAPGDDRQVEAEIGEDHRTAIR
ncbi:hypothetical protein Daus18300_005992 [Diaporthe australafricana]|uniref:Amidase domain-containing protein n=1 Tax=Diaporthe australafricana TaxID=127596 RepID=A0ABR3WXF0_9PEZI